MQYLEMTKRGPENNKKEDNENYNGTKETE